MNDTDRAAVLAERVLGLVRRGARTPDELAAETGVQMHEMQAALRLLQENHQVVLSWSTEPKE